MEMLFADRKGKLFDGPGFSLAGRLGDSFVEPLEEEMIPLPEGATLTMLPERHPVAIDLKTGEFTGITVNPYQEHQEPVYAVGALLPQGYTRTLVPAFTGGQGKKPLPLLGYTLCGIKSGQIYVAAKQTDAIHKWSPTSYNTKDLKKRINNKRKLFQQNRILEQLSLCSLDYGCFTAQNMFYERWEAGMPVSPVCNAQCVGCISEQAAECCPAPQRRLTFVPRVAEVVELGIKHLTNEEAIMSFGQGCEGEPSLQADLISEAIKKIRAKTNLGTINMNTNAGYTEGILKICQAGIDSLRVSLNSASPDYYHLYYQPKNYTFDHVVASLKVAQKHGLFVSLNLLTFPGVNDREEEVAALINLVKETGVKMIQLRNLNIDPDQYLAMLPQGTSQPVGILEFLKALRENLPDVTIGNYSHPVKNK